MSPLALRNIRLLNTFNFCSDFRIYAPIAVVYFAHVTGSYALAVLLFSIAKISSTILEVPTGLISDRVGRRLTIIAGQAASILSVGCYAFGGDFRALAAGAAFEGLAFSCFSGNNEALLYDTLKEEGRHDQYADYQGGASSMFQIALAISAALAAVVLLGFGMRQLFVLSLIPQTIGLAVAFLFHEPAQHDRRFETNIFSHLSEAFAAFAHNARLRELSIASILGFAVGEANHMFYPAFFALLWPSWALGVAGFITHGLATLGFRAAGRLVRRFGELRVLLWSSVASKAFLLSALVVPNVTSPAVSSLASLLFGPNVIAQGSLMQKGFTDAQRATMASLIAFGGNLLFAVAVYALGALADRVGPRYALLTAEILAISVTLLYWRLYRSVSAEMGSKMHEDQAAQR